MWPFRKKKEPFDISNDLTFCHLVSKVKALEEELEILKVISDKNSYEIVHDASSFIYTPAVTRATLAKSGYEYEHKVGNREIWVKKSK